MKNPKTLLLSLFLSLAVGVSAVSLANDAIDAAQTYNKGVELFRIAQIQREKGNAKGQEDLLKKSIEYFEQAAKEDKTLVEAQSNVGFAYLTLGKHKDAISAFEKALKINPQHLNTLNGLATTYAQRGKFDDALKAFEKLTTLDPGNAQYLFNMGSVLQQAERFDDAKTAYQRALKLSPKHQHVLFNLATLYENQGQVEEAKGYYQQAKTVDISNPIGLEALNRLQTLKALDASKTALQ